MADYWKSQPKKFCQYCKCWIADNKPSVEFHERGKNHKENVAAKIAEIKKRSLDKAKQEERESKEFAAMEEAAMKAYEKDLRRMMAESGSQAQTTAPARPEPKKTKEQTKRRAQKVSGGLRESKAWVEGKTEDGHTYFYNTVTGDSRWENPEGFQGESSHSSQPGRSKGSSGSSAWMEAVSPDGYTYYYNNETGESSWERPAELPVPFEQRSGSGSGSGSSREAEGQEGPSPTQPEPLSGVEDSSNGAQADKEAGGDGQDSEQSKAPKISFRTTKPETEPSEKEGEDKSSGDNQKEGGDGVEKGEEEAKKPEAAPEEETPAKRPRTANPYGAWEQVQEEEDPYANVDLQLPQVEGGAASAPPELPPEPKPKFRERTITSLGDLGGPTSFRKSKMQNGKNKSLRQRATDDD